MKFAHHVYVCVKVRIILRIYIISLKSTNNFDIKLLIWLINYVLCHEGVWGSKAITPLFLGQTITF
jgi:hypothetical protein